MLASVRVRKLSDGGSRMECARRAAARLPAQPSAPPTTKKSRAAMRRVLTNFVSTRLIAALLFFVVGGALGWAGSRAAARRAHSILEPPSDNFLTLTDASIPKPLYSNQSAQPEADTTASGLENREENDLTQQEATIEASEQEWDVS